MKKPIIYALIFACLFIQAPLSAEKMPPLPLNSRLIDIDGRQIHINQRGDTSSSNAIVLLSGPTDYWNSDSAWFAMLLPQLAKSHHVIAIDRPGNAWSEVYRSDSNYVQFASDVDAVLSNLQIKSVRFIAFASANITLNSYMSQFKDKRRVEGALLIDPDVLTEFSVDHYKSGVPKGWKEKNKEWNDYVAEGGYSPRSMEIRNIESKHLDSLLSEANKARVDWTYFERALDTRLVISRIQTKVNQVSVYGADVEYAYRHPLPKSLPIVVLNTDFETAYLTKIEDEKERVAVTRWRDEGDNWYRSIADAADKGFYVKLDTQDHLSPLFDLPLIESSLQMLDTK